MGLSDGSLLTFFVVEKRRQTCRPPQRSGSLTYTHTPDLAVVVDQLSAVVPKVFDSSAKERPRNQGDRSADYHKTVTTDASFHSAGSVLLVIRLTVHRRWVQDAYQNLSTIYLQWTRL